MSAPVWADASSAKIEIPEALGSAQEYHHAGPKLVIFIQDIHASVKVQQDIASLIELLVGKYGLKTVAYEGNEGVIDTEKVFWYPDANLKKAVSEKFLQKLELSGPEFARINSKIPFQLTGMEDIRFYNQNLKLAKSALRVRQETLNVLKEIENLTVESFRKVSSSKESLRLFQIENDYRENKIQAPDYIQELMKIYSDSAFTLLINSEKDLSQIHSREFFEKLEAVSKKAETVVFKKSSERRLNLAMEHLMILKELVNLTATRAQVLSYRKDPERFKERWLRDSIQNVLGHKEAYARFQDSLDDLMNVVNDFYSMAIVRDEVMAERLLKELSSQNSIVFVAGGFHTQGITERLRKENISYILVQPKFEGREALSEKIYFDSLAEVSNDRAAQSVFSIAANKISKITKFTKDSEAALHALQEVDEAVLAGAESGEFKVKPSLLREIALANGKSLGSGAVDWTPVLNRSLLIPPSVYGNEILRKIAMDEIRFAHDLKELPNKPLLKLAAFFDTFGYFKKMYEKRSSWEDVLQELLNDLTASERYRLLALFRYLETQVSKGGEFAFDDHYTRLLVQGFEEALGGETEYEKDITALKTTEVSKLSKEITEIVRYSRGKEGVALIQKAEQDGKLNIKFLKAMREDQFKNALALLAKNRNHALLQKIRQTGPWIFTNEEILWMNHIIQALEPELPQIALAPEDAVNALFILNQNRASATLSISIFGTLESAANSEDMPPPLRAKLQKAFWLVKAKFEEIRAARTADLTPPPGYRQPKHVDIIQGPISPRIKEEGEDNCVVELGGPPIGAGAGLYVYPLGGDGLFDELPKESEEDAWAALIRTAARASQIHPAGKALTALYKKLQKDLMPEGLARQLYRIIQINPNAKPYVMKFVRDAAKNGFDNIPSAKLIEVEKQLEDLISDGKSLGQRDRTLLIQINSNDDALRYSAEAARFLSATENTHVVFVIPEWELRTHPVFAELRRKFKNRADIHSNKLLSSRDIAELNKYISNRKGDFALIASYESLEKAKPLDGLILLTAEKIDGKSGAEIEKIIPSALMNTAWRALAAGPNDMEFVSRTRGLDNGRIFVVTSEYLGELFSHLLAEHSYEQQYLSAA